MFLPCSYGQIVDTSDYAKHVTAGISGEIKKLKWDVKKAETKKVNVLYAKSISVSAWVDSKHARNEAMAW